MATRTERATEPKTERVRPPLAGDRLARAEFERPYEPMPVSGDSIYRSQVVPGLWLDPAAVIAGDAAKVLQVLPEGLAHATHSKLVSRLQEFGPQSTHRG